MTFKTFTFDERDPDVVRKFRPTNNNVLVLLDVTKQASASGLIIMPTAVQLDECTGVVVSVSPEAEKATALSPTDRVLLMSSRGTMIHENSKAKRSFVLYDMNDIIATMEV